MLCNDLKSSQKALRQWLNARFKTHKLTLRAKLRRCSLPQQATINLKHTVRPQSSLQELVCGHPCLLLFITVGVTSGQGERHISG